jgi:flagellar motor component MotA
VGGTTYSNAAFFAASGTKPLFGMVVTSLGSMLAMKNLSQTYV